MLPKANRKIVISIDAGHGGEDPGALGPKGIREKVVAFQIAQRLEKLFDKNPDFSGELVRTGDYYLAHRKRTAIARKIPMINDPIAAPAMDPIPPTTTTAKDSTITSVPRPGATEIVGAI